MLLSAMFVNMGEKSDCRTGRQARMNEFGRWAVEAVPRRSGICVVRE
jgi:hypothetical protein